ncbi:hypothetical protein H7F17_12310 [Roseburia hominis]|uniref:hypothetical protein n=1 Tax=Roseburia hominis TaxID=301301 RepID=UPI00306886F4|nr:hypothetical protein [Roseburia hominis]
MRENQSAARDAECRTGYFCTLSYCKGSCIDNVRDSQQNAAVLLYGYTKAQGTDRKGFYCGQCSEICGVRHKSRNQFFTVRRSSKIC